MAERRVWRDCLIVAIVLGLVGSCAYYGLFVHEDDRVQPGTPEYAAYIKQQVDDCVKQSLADDLKKSREELPVLPTAEERRGVCEAVVLDIDSTYPEARPRRDQSN